MHDFELELTPPRTVGGRTMTLTHELLGLKSIFNIQQWNHRFSIAARTAWDVEAAKDERERRKHNYSPNFTGVMITNDTPYDFRLIYNIFRMAKSKR